MNERIEQMSHASEYPPVRIKLWPLRHQGSPVVTLRCDFDQRQRQRQRALGTIYSHGVWLGSASWRDPIHASCVAHDSSSDGFNGIHGPILKKI